MEETKYNELSIVDKGNGNVEITLNNQNITKGVLNYSIYRDSENNNTVRFKCEMIVMPKEIDIKRKKNLESSVN